MRVSKIFLVILAQRFGDGYLATPEDVCPSNLSDCLTGENHVIACYQAVEKLRVQSKLCDEYNGQV